MTQTPSARRRLGRNAFDPASDVQDFIPKTWWSTSYRQDFVDGWHDARISYEAREDEEPTVEERLDAIEERLDRLDAFS